MREIKFRGKAIMSIEELNELEIKHKDGWVYGNLIKDDNEVFIVGGIAEVCEEYINPEWWVAVDPETVGQYTGFKDATGKEIYEGDILEFAAYKTEVTIRGQVVFERGCFLIDNTCTLHDNTQVCDLIWPGYKCKVIGNVFENPELLKDKDTKR